MKKLFCCAVALLMCRAAISFSQTSQSSASSSTSNPAQISALAPAASEDFVHAIMQKKPWDRGVFLNGGLGTDGETGDHFLSAGIRIGKVLSSPIVPGIFRGQFEYAAEIIPYWQAFTPKETYILSRGTPPQPVSVTTGGTYTGLSLTPIILRWNLVGDSGHWKRILPWVQGAGGLVWTNHKFPPNGSRGTSVWNFEPQFGLGFHYFVKPGQSITFAANAVHISNASLGDSNPGVNATVQFQIGYTFWK